MHWPKLKNWCLSLLRNHAGGVLLVLVWLAIVATNLELGTWFLGWDSLASEFNPLLNIQRSLLGTWQSFQGLGLLGGHGYAAQLPHAFFQLLLSAIIPTQYLRYAFTFIMLLSGVLGAYSLLQQLIASLHEKTVPKYLPQIASTIGGLVYMLHLGTVQTFYVQLEPFIVMYGLLPWVLLALLQLINKFTAKKAALFFGLNVALSVIGFVPPVFISCLLFVGIMLLTWILVAEKKNVVLRQSLVIGACIVAANLYWLVPVASFTLSQSNHYLSAKLNQISTTEFIYTSNKFGTLGNVALLKGFLFDSLDQARFTDGETLETILVPWTEHLQKWWVRWIGYGMALVAVVAGSLSFKKWQEKKSILTAFPITALATFGLLATTTFPFSLLSVGLRYIPVLNQAFRIPYSKVSMSASLFLALFFGIGVYFLLQFLAKKTTRWAVTTASSGILLLVMLYSWPAFQGHFLYQGAKVSLPPEYQQVMDFFASKPNYQRVALLPAYTFTGWDMHQWQPQGYTGSGFWWYGIEQPILSRSFDVWSPYNETFRFELQRAVYAQDPNHLAQLIEKYDISYFLIDNSVYLPNVENEVFYRTESVQLLKNIPGIEQTATFGDIQILSYLPNLQALPLSIPSKLTLSEQPPIYARFDPTTAMFGEYISVTKEQADSFKDNLRPVIFPFSGLQTESISTIDTSNSQVEYTADISFSKTSQLVLPELEPGSNVSQVAELSVLENTLQISFISPLQIRLGSTNVEYPTLTDISIPLESTASSLVVAINDELFYLEPDQQNQEMISALTYQQPIEIEYFDYSVAEITPEQVLVPEEHLYSASISAEIWDDFVFPTHTTIPASASQIQVTLPTQLHSVFSELTETKLINCDTDATGSIDKFESPGGITYSSRLGGVGCDSIEVPELSNHSSYILTVRGKNEAGRSLRMYVRNLATNRVEPEVLLPTDEYEYTIGLPDWDNQPESFYSINFENRSYGTETARNELTAVDVRSLPLTFDWLSSIKVVPENYQMSNGPAQVAAIKQWGSGLYSFTASVTEPTVFTLSQAYDDKWIGLAIDQAHNPITLTHLQANGWANAWEIPTGTFTIYIIYVPQVVSLLGSSSLVICSLTAFWMAFRLNTK